MNKMITLLTLACAVQLSLNSMNSTVSLPDIYAAGHKAFDAAKKAPHEAKQRKAIVKEALSEENFTVPDGIVEIILDYEGLEAASSNIVQAIANRAVHKDITFPKIMKVIQQWLEKGRPLQQFLRRGDLTESSKIIPLFFSNDLSTWEVASRYYGDDKPNKAEWHKTAQPLMDLYCEIYRVYNKYYAEGKELPAEQFDPDILKKKIGWLGN